MLALRPYQQAAVEAVYAHLRSSDDNPCVVIPTGGGKTPVIATICKDAVARWGGRVLILAHVKELLEQAVQKLRAVCPEIKAGIYSAGLNRRDTEHPVIVAGIQSVYKRACELDAFDLVIVDECHMIPEEGDGMYRQFLVDARKVNPQLRVIGLTATPFRMKAGLICGPDSILNAVCYEVGVRELIVGGYLSPLVTKAGRQKADTAKLHVRGGEFVAGEVEDLMDQDALVEAACAEIVEQTFGRQACLIFASGVRHGQHVARVLAEKHGLECGFVSGETSDRERAELLARFRGEANGGLFAHRPLKYLCNVNVLTTGFDAPNIDAIALLRPTMSPGLYYQMVGRGFRLHPGKANCIAEGQRVLTAYGLTPIEQVTLTMRVWDGHAFVRHGGVVYRGEQEVICYAGLLATPDHAVWTGKGWKALGECAVEQASVCVTGFGRQIVRQTDGYFRTTGPQGDSRQTTRSCGVHYLRRSVPEVLHQPDATCRRVSPVQPASQCTQVVSSASFGSERSLYKSPQSSLLRLWRAGNRIPFPVADRNGPLGARTSRTSSRHANRQDRQQRPLRARQPALCDGVAEPAEYAPQKRIRRVWDIVDAGPRHCFTCEGLLVSNCTVLDFGGNVLRHGPVDQIKVKEQSAGGEPGEAPAKECPECRSIIAAGYSKCPDCGFEFPPPERQQHEAQATSAGILSGQVTLTTYPVEETIYSVHVKYGAADDAPRTMRVDYRVGWHEYKSEWVCFEHTGYARQKAVTWWRRRSPDPVPSDVEQAVEIATGGGLAETRKITVRSVVGEPYERIVGYELGPIPEALPTGAGVYGDEEIPF